MPRMTWRKVFRKSFCRRTKHGYVVYNSIDNTMQIERFIRSLLYLAFYGVRDIAEPRILNVLCQTCSSKSDKRYCHYGLKMEGKKSCVYYHDDTPAYGIKEYDKERKGG